MVDELLKYSLNQGPWAVMAFIGLYGVWRGSKWLGMEVIKPVAARHVSFVDGVATTLTDVRDTLHVVRDELSSLRENHETHVAKCPNSSESSR